jgi:rhodanese-related sulfurtransferase
MGDSLETEWLQLIRDVDDTLAQIESDRRDMLHGDVNWLEGLQHSPTFSTLSANKLTAVLMKLEEQLADTGEVIIRQKDPGDYFYIIKSGSCTVSQRTAPGQVQIVAQLREGDSFGEAALVSGEARNASIVADGPTVLLRLAKSDFDELLKTDLVRYVTADEAQELRADGARFLDVRRNTPDRKGGYPDALYIPIDQLRDRMDEVDRDARYVIFCANGNLSETAAIVLSQRGYDVSVLKGGFRP